MFKCRATLEIVRLWFWFRTDDSTVGIGWKLEHGFSFRILYVTDGLTWRFLATDDVQTLRTFSEKSKPVVDVHGTCMRQVMGKQWFFFFIYIYRKILTAYRHPFCTPTWKNCTVPFPLKFGLWFTSLMLDQESKDVQILSLNWQRR